MVTLIPFAVKRITIGVNHAGDHGAEVERLQVEAQLSRVSQGQRPQVLDQAVEGPHLIQCGLDVLGRRVVDLIRQCFQRALQDGKGIAELVSNVRSLSAPCLLGLFQAGRHLVERHRQPRDLVLSPYINTSIEPPLRDALRCLGSGCRTGLTMPRVSIPAIRNAAIAADPPAQRQRPAQPGEVCVGRLVELLLAPGMKIRRQVTDRRVSDGEGQRIGDLGGRQLTLRRSCGACNDRPLCVRHSVSERLSMEVPIAAPRPRPLPGSIQAGQRFLQACPAALCLVIGDECLRRHHRAPAVERRISSERRLRAVAGDNWRQ